MAERFIEMAWHCAACKSANRGRDLVCSACGKEKADEEYEMPSDVERAETVVDPRLVSMAQAGANWRCRYCGSSQRDATGECATCGGERARAQKARASAPAQPLVAARHHGNRHWISAAIAGVGIVALASTAIVVARSHHSRPPPDDRPLALAAAMTEPPPIHAVVTDSGWTTHVSVDRKMLTPAEGFEEKKPADAVDVQSLGDRVHHVDQVPDGYRTETYTEREQDGFDTETYTERESCGQDCTTTPRTCRQVCNSKSNGFASCRDVCTGGDQRCTTRYCDRMKTRQKPRYRDVEKTREVPKFKPVERMAPYFSWKAWTWVHQRDFEKTGKGAAIEWPSDDQIKPPSPLGPGEKEKSKRTSNGWVTATDDGGVDHPLLVDVQDLASMGNGTELELSGPGYRVWHMIRSVPTPSASARIESLTPSASASASAPAARSSASASAPPSASR
jgi:hypothetical protein